MRRVNAGTGAVVEIGETWREGAGPWWMPWLMVALLMLTGCAGTSEPAEPAPRSGDEATEPAPAGEEAGGAGDARAGEVGGGDPREAGAGEHADRDGRRDSTAEGAVEEGAAARAEALERAAMRAATRRDSAVAADSAARVDSLAALPVAPLPVPILPGALLPRSRIVAFYGNPASERMGILGELPPEEMLARLDQEVAAWKEADPDTPVRPALQIIAIMATGDPGRDSLFRLRMPDSRIERVAEWAARRDALLILDIQPGRSTVEDEIESLIPWLARPDVHLALDPEWAMPPDGIPGRQIGSMTAAEINYAVETLAGLVETYHLPPKILVVHRFTTSMIENADAIRRDPRVQVVINMDGWGSPPQKRAAYRDIVAPEADQFTGFKIFFHNDTRDGSVLLTPAEVLQLDPPPVYIQYQ